ncbi:MAG: protein kinase [Acidobacteria bacterium]|nr:protein kinase [Acidobacteriota bacterium]
MTTLHKQIDELFLYVLDMLPEQREVFLASQDASIRKEIESLLLAYNQSNNFLDSPLIVPQLPLEPVIDKLIGRTLGDFIIREKIGEGAFGAVYKAEQITLMREVVIKVLHQKHLDNQEIIERFLREARLASRLEHPFTAHIYAFGAESDGLLWTAMEIVHGTPLDKLLKTQGTIELERFVPLLDKICEVVQTAHDCGIIHRDLKPANVMVISRAGRLLPKLLDFGIAKTLDSNTSYINKLQIEKADELLTEDDTSKTTGLLGSTPYMPAEQWENASQVDARADIYALGVFAYEMLVGKRPFSGGSPASFYNLYKEHKEAPVPSLGKGFPTALDAVIAKAMAKKPEERYKSAFELATDFRLAAGISTYEGVLPQLETQLYEKLLAAAPQPLAESVARFASARSLHQSRERMISILRVVIRYLALLALASRAQIGSGNKKDSEKVQKFIQKIRKQELSDKEWLELTQELCKPFALKRDAYPIPELISLFFQPSSTSQTEQCRVFESLLEFERANLLGATEEEVQRNISSYLPELTKILHSISFLLDYPLVVKRLNHIEKRMGRELSSIQIKLNKLSETQVALLDSSLRMVLSLWPLLQVAEPLPGAREEIFFLAGKGRHGVKLITMPTGFERQEERVWEWFQANFFDSKEESFFNNQQERTPYLGLMAFTSADADLFFGRERDTEAFLNRLKIQSLLAIVGTSGAGKSSFLQAGVFAELANNWRTFTLRPGATPVATLIARLNKEFGPIDQELKEQLALDSKVLGKYLKLVAEKHNITILIFVDQFEELFTLCPELEERQFYAAMLAQAAQSAEEPIRLVLALRDDFLVRAKQLTALKDRLTQGLELLTTPAPEDLLRILITPAERLGYQFEDENLAKEIVAEVVDQVGALPLLAFTAAKLWELRDRHFKQLLRKTYLGMGGVGGALAQHAELMLGTMNNSQQRLVKETFRQLVTGEGTRAVLTKNELMHLLGNSQEAESVLEKLIAARLLVVSEGELGQERIEIVHEALLIAWPRLVQWQQEEKENIRLRDQLRIASKQWQDRGKVKGLLWRDEALTEYRLWQSRYSGKLTESEEAFVLSSLSEAKRGQRRTRLIVSGILLGLIVGFISVFYQQQLAEESAKRAEAYAKKLEVINKEVEEKAQQILAQKQIAEDSTEKANFEKHRADEQRQLAERNEIQAKEQTKLATDSTQRAKRQLLELYEERGRKEILVGNPMIAALYLSEAYRLGKTNPSLKYLLADAMRALDAQIISLEHGKERVSLAEFSPDSSRILTIGNDETIASETSSGNESTAILWQASNGKPIKTLSVYSGSEAFARFSPNNKLIAMAGGNNCNCVQVFNSLDGSLLHTLQKHPSKVVSTSFNPKQNQILSASQDGTINIWNSNGKYLFSLKKQTEEKRTSFLYLAEFDPQGTKVVSIDGEGVKIWSLKDKTLLGKIDYEKRINSVTFSPDGTRILTASEDNTAKIWDSETGKLIISLEAHKGNVYWAEFNSLGTKVVTASADSSAKIWDVSNGKNVSSVISLEGHLEIVNTAHFTPDNTRIVTTSSDFTAKIWDSASGLPLATFQGHRGNVYSAAISHNGKRVITASSDGSAKIWDTSYDKLKLTYEANQVRDLYGLFAGKEPWVITTDSSDRVKIWDILSSNLLVELNSPIIGITLVEINPNATALLTVDYRNSIKIWDLKSGNVLLNLEGNTASFSFDNKHIATFTKDKNIKIWNSETAKLEKTFPSNLNTVNFIRFSPNGNYLITAGTIGKERNIQPVAQILEIATGKILTSFTNHQRKITSVEFSPDGTRVVTVSEDTVKIWDAKNGKALPSLEDDKGIVYLVHFSPDNTKLLTVNNDKTVKLWDSATGRMLASLEGHRGSIDNAYFSNDSKQVITTSRDKTVKVWDVSLETRSAEEISKLVSRLVPFRLNESLLISTKPNDSHINLAIPSVRKRK